MNTRRHATSGLLADITRLLLSGATAQVVALLLLYFIGRQYSQEAMGIQGLFLSWSGILAVVIMGRYEQTIVISRSEHTAEVLWYASLSLATLGSALLALGALAIDLLWVHNPLGGFIHLVAPYVLLSAITNATLMLILRRKQYTRLAIAQGIRSVSNNLIKVLLGLRTPTALSLIISAFAATCLGALPLTESLRSLTRFRWRRHYWVVLRHYIAFPLYSAPQALLNTLIGSLLVVLLPLGYGLREVGLISMIMMLVRRPLLVLSDSIGQVYLERLSRAASEQRSLRGLIARLLGFTLALALPLTLAVYLFIEEAIVLFLGNSWLELPRIIICMLPYLTVNFINSILNVLPDILGRQRLDLMAKIIRFILEGGAILIGLKLYSFTDFISYYYTLSAVIEVAYLALLLTIASNYERRSA